MGECSGDESHRARDPGRCYVRRPVNEPPGRTYSDMPRYTAVLDACVLVKITEPHSRMSDPNVNREAGEV
jgi:hypothetical protein